MIIQKSDVSDAKSVLDLQRICYQNEALIYNDFNIPPLTQTLDGLITDMKDQYFLKAVSQDGSIIGSVKAYSAEGTCYIGRLIVHPDFQNQGIGSNLMRAIEEAFPEAVRFELFTGQKSAKNLHFYGKLGYQVYKTEMLTNKVPVVYLEKNEKHDSDKGAAQWQN